MNVFSLSDKNSLYQLEDFFQRVEYEKDQPLHTIPCLLVGNKSDDFDGRQVTREEVTAFARKYGHMSYIETSAKLNKNVSQAFEDLTVKVLQEKTFTYKKENGLLLESDSNKNNNKGICATM